MTADERDRLADAICEWLCQSWEFGDDVTAHALHQTGSEDLADRLLAAGWGDTRALREAAHAVVRQLERRYDDQWATGPVMLPDLDALRAALGADRP